MSQDKTALNLPFMEEERSFLDRYGLPIAAGLGTAGLGAAALIGRNPWLRTGAKYHLAKDFGLGSWIDPKRTAKELADEVRRKDLLKQQVGQLAEHIRASGRDPSQMRIGVSGISGSGKGTLSKLLAEELGMKHVELDPVVLGRARMSDLLEGRPPEEFTGTLADRLRFWGKPSSAHLDALYAEQGMPRGVLYDSAQAFNWANPERYDALLRVDRPIEQIREDILRRGYGAFTPEIFKPEESHALQEAVFGAARGEAVPFGQATLKIKPEGGFGVRESLEDVLRERGETGFGRDTFHDVASRVALPGEPRDPGWLGNVNIRGIGKAVGGLGAVGTGAGLATHAAQERFKESAFFGDDEPSPLIPAGAAGLAGGAGAHVLTGKIPDVTPEGAARMRAFLDIDPAGIAEDPNLAEGFIRDYARAGHEAVSGEMIPDQTGREVIEDLRSGRTAKILRGLGYNVHWGPQSAEHYDAFLKSPDEAMRQLMRESSRADIRAVPDATRVPMFHLDNDMVQHLAEETADKIRRYRQFMPKVDKLIQMRPFLRAGALGTAAAGAGMLGKGLYDQFE